MRHSSLSAALGSVATVLLAPQPLHGGEDLLLLRWEGLDALLADRRDEGLRRAVDMLDERLAELPAELGAPDFPAPVMELVMELLHEPMSLRLTMKDEGEWDGGGPPFELQLNCELGSDDNARAMASRLGDLLRNASPQPPRPAPDHPGFQMVDADGETLYFGATRVGGKPVLAVALHDLSDAPLALDQTGLPAGSAPAMAATIDLEAIGPLFEQMSVMMGEGAAPLRELLTMVGVLGEDASRISLAVGYADDRAVMSGRYTNYRHLLERVEAMPERLLQADDFRLVPVDAAYASVAAFRPEGITNAIRMLIEALPEDGRPAEDPFEMIERMIGVHPDRDVLAHLGACGGVYVGNATGGGLMSTVAFLELRDPVAMQATIDTLVARANELGSGPARGYVQVRARRIDGRRFRSLLFPGLPVPVEPSFMISGRHLFVSASPQALLAAVHQADGGAAGLLDNPRFREMVGGDPTGAMQVTFNDTPELLEDGYPLVNFAMTALANTVRSPRDPDREPGLLMPSLPALRRGAKASVITSRLVGDDLVFGGQGDRSWTVNACGAAGAMGGSMTSMQLAAMFAGISMPALGRAREQAEITQRLAELRMIGIACATHAAEHGDRMPTSLRSLVEGNYLPAGGDGDFWLDPSGVTSASVRFPDQRIMAYDRASLHTATRVNVLFYDGHVEALEHWRFQQLIEAEANAGVDFELP